jgi:AraC family transcriptional regulator, regulatory protein of adaptative response / DNA-3-methyladenine glycosylase II
MVSERLAWQRARRSRDPRFDGRFFVGVTTTGIYCRPICPARLADERHVRYFRLAAEASSAGFRPCRRCRPETAPGTAAWAGTPATVQRALRLIDERVADGLQVDALAASLGIGPRHLHRLFVAHLGAGPGEVVQTRRLHFARALIDRTALPFATVAHAAGFGSIRRFNDAVRDAWRATPSSLRGRAQRPDTTAPYAFALAYRPPFDWDALVGFLGARAIPGVESVESGRYTRALVLEGTPALVSVSHDEPRHQLDVAVRIDNPRLLYAVLSRTRAVFDLCAVPAEIAARLGTDPLLRPLVERRPGLRVPGAWDPFELAVRAVVGQQVSVAAARTLLSRIVARWGAPLDDGATAFPMAPVLVDARLESVGLTGARATAVRALATSVANGDLELGLGADPVAAREVLMALPGIGPWTTEYIALRALGDPDAWPAGDAVLQRATGLDAARLAARAEAWRPWRAYAALHIWMGVNDGHLPIPERRRESRRSDHPAGRRGRAARVAVR